MVTTKKIRLIPVGEKEEKERVYKYIRDGIYSQYRILNTYMSQLGTLYYSMDRNISDPEFKSQYNAIFRNTNTAIHDIEQAKGLGMTGNCGMKVKQDFSTALKGGLAKGERQLPYYKRDFPLLVGGRFLNFYKGEDHYINDDGEEVECNAYFIKFVNGIHFKCILATGKEKRPDYFLPRLLESIVDDPDNYKVCGSSIQITKNGKIILNLSVKINKEINYKPDKRIMGLAMGYDKPMIAALSDDDKVYPIGEWLKDSIIDKRTKIQDDRKRLQIELKDASGGHGRKKKLNRLNAQGQHEKNVIQLFNHKMSKSVVDFAKTHKVSTIVIEDIEKTDLDAYPVMLRNWTYYQLQTFIQYKAKREGIEVIMSSSEKKSKRKKKEQESGTMNINNTCCKCGCLMEPKDILPKDMVWCNEIHFTCPSCGETIDYSYNKAKNMTVMG